MYATEHSPSPARVADVEVNREGEVLIGGGRTSLRKEPGHEGDQPLQQLEAVAKGLRDRARLVQLVDD